MELLRLGKRGRISIPGAVLKKLGLEYGAKLLVDVTCDGSIVLRAAGVYPIEIYSGRRVREFDEADRLTRVEAGKLAKRMRRK